MKSFGSLAAAAMLALAPQAHAADAGVAAMLRQFAEAFNKGDVAAAKALHVPAPTITDEPPPHLWSGPGAFDRWLADLSKSETAEGKTGGVVAIGVPVK